MGKRNGGSVKRLPPGNEFLQVEVITSHGRHFIARDRDNKLWQVFGKGKKREVAVGDQLRIQPSGDNQAWIESIDKRRNLVYRSDALRSKLFAANIDQVMLVLAISPPFSAELLGRTQLACHDAGVPLILVFNKIDILAQEPALGEDIQAELSEWTNDELPIFWTSFTEDPEGALETLMPELEDKTTLILGQSGMGKSTLINLLMPNTQVATNDVSIALNAGKHTTTHTQLHTEGNIRLIDSPGFQAFGLNHLTQAGLLSAFEEIEEAAKQCRFDDCKHRKEPQCAVKNGVEAGEIAEARYHFYLAMCDELLEAEKQY